VKRSFTFIYHGEEIDVTAERQGDTVTIERDGVPYTVALVPKAFPVDNSPSIASSAAASSGTREARPTVVHGMKARADEGASAAGNTLSEHNTGGNNEAGNNEAGEAGEVPAPMTGVIKEILVAPGDSVEEGEKLMIMEAMKMDIEVSAFSGGSVQKIHVQQNENVKEGQPLVLIG